MNTFSDYTLRSLFKALDARRRFIIITTAITLIAGLSLYLILPKKYKAETVFILKNPQLTDRNALYGFGGNAPYFANEDDISKLISMSESDSFHAQLIAGTRLDLAYQLDTTNRNDFQKLKKTIAKKLQLYRAENNNIVLLYFDKDPDLAANVANFSVPLLDRALRSFYTRVRLGQIIALRDKIYEQDSIINVLTDTLVNLREQYGIYALVNPARHNIMTGNVENSGKPGFARGLEVIQNIESVKDELVSSRATNITLLGQYTTGTKLNDQPITEVIKTARPPVQPVLRLSMVIVLCIGAGLFFGVMYALVAFALYNRNR